MKNKLGLALLVNLYSMVAWSSFAPPDLTVVNTSDRAGAVFIANHSCEETSSCVIKPNSSVHLDADILQAVCADTPERCTLTFSISEINTAIATGEFSLKEGIRYIASSRWLEYTARDLTNTVVEIYKK